MPQLILQLFGSFQATFDQRPIKAFESNKVRALLAYLAVEPDRPHWRDELMGLLWPEQTDAMARANLRQALTNLRLVIGDRTSTMPFLSATVDSVQFNLTPQCSVDVVTFTELLAACQAHTHRRLETCRSCAQRLQQAVELYQGDFLAQFVQNSSEAFEEWVLIRRERLHREALEALHILAQHFEWRGNYDQALRYAQRELELDPWREEAHRQAMRALALSGRRSAALAQYETCRRVLIEELGAEPAEDTTVLFQQIKAGLIASDIPQRPWLTPATPLIGRESELAEVNAIWHKARTGEGRAVLIGGEPGIGKTRLVQELIAQERYDNVIALTGECYAEGGAPFAPIVQVLQAAVDLQGLQNLRSLTPSIIADLITFVPALRDRFPDIPLNLPLEPQAEQQRRFESVTSFLSALAARTSVLIILEDVHWADSATLALLRHITRRLRRSKVLIVATHRETTLDDTRLFHDWLGDLQRERLATTIHLTPLDRENTRELLAALFREAITPEFLDGIYDATEGNPFFVTEVCQALVDEGAVFREGDGWQRLSMAQIQIPQSVRLAIQRRIAQLPEAVQDSLHRAAVLGREFEFNALRAMSDLNEDMLIAALETAERAQLIDEVVHASHTARVKFAFTHALIPSTLLQDGLSKLRRQRLHLCAAQVIEQIAQQTDRNDELAVQLAQHYTEANEIGKAIECWLKAGECAQRLYAYAEALAHYHQALTLSKEQGSVGLTTAARTAMKLGTLYHTLFNFDLAQQAYDEAFDLWQRVQETQMAHSLPSSTPHALRQYWDDFETLDLTTVTNTGVAYRIYQIFGELFSGLVELTPDLDLVPDLAHHWEVFENGRKYVFHLRPDAYWSDGMSVTAHDFEYAWKRALNPVVPSPNAEYFFGLKGAKDYHAERLPANAVGVTALDNITLVVELEEPIGHFLYLLAHHATFAIPRHMVDALGAAWSLPEHLVTNGPFRLETWRRGKFAVFIRNATYHGRWGGNLTRIELVLGEESTESLEPYEQDQHDLCWVSPRTLEQARWCHPHEYVNTPHAATFYVAFDTTRPPLADARVRQALAHALDRSALANIIGHDSVSPAKGGLVPPGLPGHTADIGLAYDPERARRLLAEAGYPNGCGFPVIEVWDGADGAYPPFFNSLTTQWRDQLGIQVHWKHLEGAEFLKRLQAEPPSILFMTWHAEYLDPDSFLRMLMHQPYMRWRSTDYEQLVEIALRCADQTERLKYYASADRLLMQEVPIVPLFYGRWHHLLKPWVKQYSISPLKASYWKDVIIEPH